MPAPIPAVRTPRDARLDHRVVAQHGGRAHSPAGGLGLRELHEGAKTRTSDAESDAGKPHAIEGEHRNVVERTALAPVRDGIAPRGVFLRHEQIADFVVVARGAAQPGDVPGVLDVRPVAAEEHGAIDRIAFCIPARLIGGFENRRMPAHPGGVGAAARKSPFAGDAVAAVDGDGLGHSRGRPPGDQRVGCPKDLARNFWVEKSGRVRARGCLCKTPGRACIGRRDRLDDLIEGDEIDGAAAERHRQQHVEQAASMHRRQDIRRNLPLLFGAAGSGLDHRHERASPRDPILSVLDQQRSPPRCLHVSNTGQATCRLALASRLALN